MQKIIGNVEKVITGKRKAIELALISVISGGHVLVEDVPGVGKTSLVSAFARSIDCSYKRIQFTPDVMPSDITGFSVWNPKIGDFEYKKGAVLNQFVQADEINRTSSKTQASLLEVMEERQVTVDSVTYPAPDPFIVFATQNPADYVGTFLLPEAQLDRFFMRISLGYPSPEDETKIVLSKNARSVKEQIGPVASAADITAIGKAVDQVFLEESVGKYIVDLACRTRTHEAISLGASPRASINLAKASRAWAFFNRRDYAMPDDVQKMAHSILGHRIFLKREAKYKSITTDEVITQIINQTRVIR